MATVLEFDELNRLHNRKGKNHSMPIARYFSEMELKAGEIKDREEFAKDMKEEIFAVMAFLFIILERKQMDMVFFAKTRLSDAIKRIFMAYTYPDSETLLYIERYSSEFVDTTIRHTQDIFTKESIEDALLVPLAYWFSEDRATYNAENETNTLFNHEQFRQAKSDGLLYKRWRTMKDERVRETHVEVDDTVIPIDELFHVGEYLMRYPRDASHGAGVEEIAGCRCTVVYF